MWYLIINKDMAGDPALRAEARPAHMARLAALKDLGRLLAAGPFPAIDSEDPGPAGYTGSMVIAEFDSLDAAREWAETEPYVKLGIYGDVTIQPFRKILP